MKKIQVKRIYEKPSTRDGYRMLVDRLWPRGVKKEDAKLDEWNKDIAPSNKLRKWFDHDPKKFEEFSNKYNNELNDRKGSLDHVHETLKDQNVTLLYAAKNKNINHAVVLCKYLKREKHE